MAPQSEVAKAAWGRGERGSRVTRHSDWNIRHRVGLSHSASSGAE